MKKKKGYIILFVIVAALYALILELSKNTVWGWGIFAAVMVVFLILYIKKLGEKKPAVRFLS